MTPTLAREVHASNVAAGWWPRDRERNRAEILMLVVSEVAEASGGHLDNLMDDKLPHLKMFDVELADTAIRLLDVIGADAADHPYSAAARLTDEIIDVEDVVDAELMVIVREVAGAMEAHRKGRVDDYRHHLWRSLAAVYTVAETHGIDLDSVIAEKRAFNAVRADHKLEARAAVGGKAY